MTTYTLTGGTAVFRDPITDDVTSVDQTDITVEIVVPDSTTSFSYTVNPLNPGDGPGDETVDITLVDYNIRLNGTDIGPDGIADPETTLFTVDWVQNGVAKQTTVLLLYVENDPISGGGIWDADYIFTLDGDPLPAMGTPAAWNTFESSLTSIVIPTGAYGPNTNIALTSLGGTKNQNDTIIGTDGDDTYYGGAGKDVINGLDGDDQISGGAGKDRLRGGDGDDYLVGGSNDDRLFGGNGSDQLNGGTGDDYLNPGDNMWYDFISAGTGNDTVDFKDLSVGYAGLIHSDLDKGIVANINAATNVGTIDKGTNGLTTILDVKNPMLAGADSGGLGLYGTAHADVFNVTFGADFGWVMVLGSAGDDTFNIGSGNGQVRLDYVGADHGISINLKLGRATDDGFGNVDQIIGTGDVWEVSSTMGDDTVLGSAADESFILMAGTDIVNGRLGYDRLRYDRNGVDGVDIDLDAGTGTGLWSGQAFSHTISGIEWLRGSNGNDDLTGANGQENRIEGRKGNDIIDGGDLGDTLEGQDGDDDIAAAAGDDVVTGGDGNDILRGEAGKDDLRGGNDNDTIKGGTGNDKLFGDAGIDRLEGGAGKDVLNGGAQNDILLGGGGNDKLIGGGGRDQLNGQAGNDTMTGGGGIDTFVFSTGNDVITDFNTIDKIDLSSVASITGMNDLRNNHTEDIDGNLVIDDGAGNTLTLNGVTEASLQANDFLF